MIERTDVESFNNEDYVAVPITETSQSTQELGSSIAINEESIADSVPRLARQNSLTESVYESVVETALDAPSGDSPFPLAYSSTKKFWVMMFWSGLIGAVMGLVDTGFLNAADEIPVLWVNCDFSTKISCGDFYNGQLYWIPIVGVTGFFVGLIAWLTNLPKNLPGFYHEIHAAEGNLKWGFIVSFLSMCSLSGGAALGPEQGIGGLGAGIGQFIREYFKFEDESDGKMLVLCGIAGAMGALFPSPVLAAVMVFELSTPPKPYVEAFSLLFFSAFVSWCIFEPLAQMSYAVPSNTNSIKLGYQWNSLGFQQSQVVVGFICGCICAGLGFMILLIQGVCTQVFNRLRYLLSFSSFLQAVVPAVVGGVVIGTINWALPLTVGRGSLQTQYFINFASNAKYGVSIQLLFCTGFSRMVTLSVSNSCGFKGGLFFSIISIGIIFGTIAYRYYNYLPYALLLSCFMSGVAAAIAPIPIALCGIAWFTFFLGEGLTVPVFVCCLTAYSILSGCGILQILLARQKLSEKQESSNRAANDESNKDMVAVANEQKLNSELN